MAAAHMRNMFRKLDVSSRVEVARAAEHARARGAGTGALPKIGHS
jgi:DNA-binding CsgD family transcriptional regulator